MKRKDHTIQVTDDLDDNEELPIDISSKKKKPLTKAAVAKKMIKKQIKPNQKTVFDETGEVLIVVTFCIYNIVMCLLFYFRPY